MTSNMNLKALTTEEVNERREKYGKNELVPKRKENFVMKVLHILAEPMFLLLIAAAIIYFILGEPRDGAIMLVFVIGVISIDVIQEWKTDRTLKALKDLSAPKIKVIRDGEEQIIPSVDLVPGDHMIITEGSKIPADGMILSLNDLCVDESSLTGEAMGVWKESVVHSDKSQESVFQYNDYWRRDYVYAGTLVIQGNALVVVDKIGAATEYGKIGVNVAEAKEEQAPLQRQTRKLVKTCAIIAIILFITVGVITFFNLEDHNLTDRIIESILSGITLAMAMIPEEFPVILTVFLSMGAWRLAKKNSLVRKLPSVETLGSVSVLCVDKTGTITMNQMTVQEIYAVDGNKTKLCETMGLACEMDAYDPMEKAMLLYCGCISMSRDNLFNGRLITEYSFTNETKMMGHVWEKDGRIRIASKGSMESIFEICNMSKEQRVEAEKIALDMSKLGLRVIAVGEQWLASEEEIPQTIYDCKLTLCGLIGLADPPRETVKEDIKTCTEAGIRVVMITGDNGITAASIAKQIGMPNSDHIITGDELNQMTDEELKERVKEVSIFSRVIPEHKMRIVQAFKSNGEIVAMTGDGVNDAPALKYADIGIAMGKRGSEVSREAADLILMDDNFSTIVDTVEDGRRIYDNIRKAVGYVFTIHIPIAFASLIAPLLKISPASLMLLPLHVVLLELIIDPTCSIVLERQPAESNIMKRVPRKQKEKLLTAGNLTKSVVQGLVIFAASFLTYYMMIRQTPNDASTARAMGIAVIMLSNLFLVQVNSSNHDFAVTTFVKLIKDKVMWAVNIGTIAGLAIILYTPMAEFLKLAPLSGMQLLQVLGTAFLSVAWYEVVKLIKKLLKKSRT